MVKLVHYQYYLCDFMAHIANMNNFGSFRHPKPAAITQVTNLLINLISQYEKQKIFYL